MAEQLQDFTSIYTMFFRKDSNHLQSKNFRLAGDLKHARERAEKHCEVIKAKFNFVQPFISNLDREEDYFLGKSSTTEQPKELVK
jgi:hypothetical protein